MTVRIYKSTDAGAPVLSGVAGEFVNLWDKCLVTGYGAMAAAGWSKPYTGTNKAVFRQGTGSNQFYLRVEDYFGSDTFRYAKCRGYEAMSAVDTGTNAFPTTAQLSEGIQFRYCDNAVPRPWVVVADERTAYVFTDPLSTGSYFGMMFGEFYSYVAPFDNYRCALMGSIDVGAPHIGLDNFNEIALRITTELSGHYVARKYDGSGTSLRIGKSGDMGTTANFPGNVAMKGMMPYPDGLTGGLHLSPIYLHEVLEPVRRGKLRGMWHWPHLVSGIGDGDIIVGTGEYVGKQFYLVVLSRAGGVYVVEISNTWASN
jgi:hypothetical protein